MKTNKVYFLHIIDEISFIIENTKSISKDEFINNHVLKRALIRSIEIIGEAVKNISSELKKKYSNIEWKKIAGSRDKIIHGYFTIDYDIIWDIVKNKIPELKDQLNKLLELEGIVF